MKLPAGYVPGVGAIKASGFGGYGERILKQQGWQKGQGLGAEGQGNPDALKVAQKSDLHGVGQKQQREVNADWWEQQYNSFAQNLDQEDASQSESSSDEDSDSPCLNTDGTKSSASKEELKLAAELGEGRWGRFGGRKGKLKRIREQEAALLAKLTGALPQANADPSSKQASFEKQENEDSSSQTCSRRKMKRKPKLKGTKKSQAGVVVRQGPNPEQVQAAQPSLRFTEVCVEQSGLPRLEHLDSVRPGWWGEATFSSAGCLDGIQTEQSNLRDQGFTEDTQANIYNEAQTKKTAGKQGLGIGSGGGKLKGLQWAGKRTVFEPSSEVWQANSSANGHTTSANEACQIVKRRKSHPGLTKMSRKILKKEGCPMTLKKLSKRLKNAMDSEMSAKDIRSALTLQAAQDSRLQLDVDQLEMKGHKIIQEP